MGNELAPDHRLKHELQRAEQSLGQRGQHWDSGANALNHDPRQGGENSDRSSLLEQFRRMVQRTPVGAGVSALLEPHGRQSPAQDPLAGVHAVQQQLGLGWPNADRLREAMYESMDLSKLDQVVGESAAVVKDHWVISLAGLVLRVAAQGYANRKAKQGNVGYAVALQLADVALTFGPLAPQGKAWLQAVEFAATTTDDALHAAAMDEAKLHWAKLVVNLAMAGLAALPRSGAASNAIKNVTPESLVSALQTALTVRFANALQAFTQPGSVQKLLNLVGGYFPALSVVSAATGDLGELSVMLQQGIGSGGSSSREPAGNAAPQPNLEGVLPFQSLSATEQQKAREISALFHPALTQDQWNAINEHFRQLQLSGKSPDHSFLFQELAAIHIKRSAEHFQAVKLTVSDFKVGDLNALSSILRSPILKVWSHDIGLTEKLKSHLPKTSFEFKALDSLQKQWSIEGEQFKQFETKLKDYIEARLESVGLDDALSEKFSGELFGLQAIIHGVPQSELQQRILAIIDQPLWNLSLFFHQGSGTGFSDPLSSEAVVPSLPQSKLDLPPDRQRHGPSHHAPGSQAPQIAPSVLLGPPKPLAFHDGSFAQLGQRVVRQPGRGSDWVDKLFAGSRDVAEPLLNNHGPMSGEMNYQFIRQVGDSALLRSMDGPHWLVVSRREFAAEFAPFKEKPSARPQAAAASAEFVTAPLPSLLDIPPMPGEEIIAFRTEAPPGRAGRAAIAVYRVLYGLWDHGRMNYLVQDVLEGSGRRTLSYEQLRNFTRWQLPKTLQDRLKTEHAGADIEKFYRDFMKSQHFDFINDTRRRLHNKTIDEGEIAKHLAQLHKDLAELDWRIAQSHTRETHGSRVLEHLQQEELWRFQLRVLKQALQKRLNSPQPQEGGADVVAAAAAAADVHAIAAMTTQIQDVIDSHATASELQLAQQELLEQKKLVVARALRYVNSNTELRSKVFRQLDKLGEAISKLGNKVRYMQTRRPLSFAELKKKIPETLTAEVVVDKVNDVRKEFPVTQLELSDTGSSYVLSGNNTYRLETVSVYEVWVPSYEP